MMNKWDGGTDMRFFLFTLLGIAGFWTKSAELPRDVDNSGFLYGTVTMKDGSVHRGYLRWDDQEAFWDDHFNGSKDRTPYQDYGKGKKKGKSGINLLGIIMNGGMNVGRDRQFLARFGDMQRITVTGAESADILMKNQKSYGVTGSSDVGAKIQVRGGPDKMIELDWQEIHTIEFQAAPADLPAPRARMYGAVQTDRGNFRGYILWDKQECLASDIIDGRDEQQSHQVPLGEIREIEKVDNKSCRLTLRNGDQLLLHGSNDVNRSNRGIDIEDARFGRVTVSWRAFKKLTFEDHSGSGRPFHAYRRHHLLHGKVIDKKGNTLTGRLVFDLDESERWEIMDGRDGKVDYAIAFGIIDTLEPAGRKRCKAVLINGESLLLGGSNDVNTGNGGVLIYEYNANPPTYLSWRQIKYVKFNNIDLERAMAAQTPR